VSWTYLLTDASLSTVLSIVQTSLRMKGAVVTVDWPNSHPENLCTPVSTPRNVYIYTHSCHFLGYIDGEGWGGVGSGCKVAGHICFTLFCVGVKFGQTNDDITFHSRCLVYGPTQCCGSALVFLIRILIQPNDSRRIQIRNNALIQLWSSKQKKTKKIF
jgi:hypothetical protein